MMKSIFMGVAFSAALVSSAATATEAKDLAAGIKCMPAKKIIKMTRKFDKLKPEKRDTVGVAPEMR
ncbi:MAG: hypothetical protein L3J05_07850, partial [Robiginitomaculum sp.]|nr:hypothetical protein [Robiginitomaculum sp.]